MPVILCGVYGMNTTIAVSATTLTLRILARKANDRQAASNMHFIQLNYFRGYDEVQATMKIR